MSTLYIYRDELSAGAVGVYRKWQKFQYPRLVHEQRKKFAESRVNTGASGVERGDSHFVHPQALRITTRLCEVAGRRAINDDRNDCPTPKRVTVRYTETLEENKTTNKLFTPPFCIAFVMRSADFSHEHTIYI